ncbi:hypothetical protein GYMLUDRAFT_70195 [Collybiopsis luxurians FD-317 M1]|nr:hypothetical protein GYMLUDRAFT_70195 [Collybiopsis luxurians FD-317 M1]
MPNWPVKAVCIASEVAWENSSQKRPQKRKLFRDDCICHWLRTKCSLCPDGSILAISSPGTTTATARSVQSAPIFTFTQTSTVMARLHSIILVGSSVKQDGWMLADAVKLAWAVTDAEEKGENVFLAPIPLHEYDGSTDKGCLLGFDNVPRLLVPHPDRPKIIRNLSRLKNIFFSHLRRLALQLAPDDVLFVAFSSHGREGDGAILLGGGDSAYVYITVEEVEDALKAKPASGRIVLWASACYSGYWNEGKAWASYTASKMNEETWSIPESTSGDFRGSRHMLASFSSLGHQAGIEYPHPAKESCHFSEEYPPLPTSSEPLSLPSLAEATLATLETFPGSKVMEQRPQASMTKRPLPFPVFSHAALAKLKLVSSEPAQASISASPQSQTGAVPSVRTSILKESFESAVKQYRYPSTPSATRLRRLMISPDDSTTDDLIVHLISYHEHILFLAGSLLHTGVWNGGRRDQVQIPAGVKPMEYFELQRGEDAVSDLWPILETTDQVREGFVWNTSAPSAFVDAWLECGAPDYRLEDLESARTKMKDWVKRVGQAEPELLCSCQQHLLLTKEECRELFQSHQKKQALLDDQQASHRASGHSLTQSLPSFRLIGANCL